MVAWWGVGWCLSPRPAWILDFPEPVSVRGPSVFNSQNEWLFDTDFSAQNKVWLDIVPAFLVDIHSGVVLQRLLVPPRNVVFFPMFGHNFGFDTNLHSFGGGLWHLITREVENETVFELRAIDKSSGSNLRSLHTWNFSTMTGDGMMWGPPRTGLLITKTHMPLSLFSLLEAATPGTLIPSCAVPEEDPEYARRARIAPILISMWELIGDPEEKVRLRSGWILPADCDANSLTVSPDCCWCAFTRHPATGDHSIVIFDTRTGIPDHEITVSGRSLGGVAWPGPYLFCTDQGLYPRLQSGPMLIREPTYTVAKAHPLFDATSGTRIQIPDGLEGDPSVFAGMECHPFLPDLVLLHLSDKKSDQEVFLTLLRRGERMESHGALRLPKYHELHWLGQENLMLATGSKSQVPPFLTKMAESREWLKSMLKFVWAREVRTVTILDQSGEVLWQRNDVLAMNHNATDPHYTIGGRTNPDPTRLILASGETDDFRLRRLECYELPMRFYAHWWERIAGILVVVLSWYGLRSRKVKSSA